MGTLICQRILLYIPGNTDMSANTATIYQGTLICQRILLYIPGNTDMSANTAIYTREH